MSNVRAKHNVETSLMGKGFNCSRATDHNYFIYHTLDGRKTPIKTKTSFGHKPKDIAGDLLRAMARQCKISTDQFLQLIDCPLSRQDYEDLLNRDGHI